MIKPARRILFGFACGCLLVAGISSAAQQPPAAQPPQDPNVILTPFGPRQVPGPTAQPPQDPNVILTPFGPRQVPGPPAATPQPQAVPAAPPAAPAPAQADDAVPISLHLDNADIYQIIRIIGDALNLNYVIDPSVKGTVNINTSGTLHRSDLLPILETILKINGATMVKVGNFYQIVPVSVANRQPLPVQEQGAAAVPDDQIVLQIVRMKFVAASEMSRLLMPYLSEGASVVTHDTGNILLLSERRSNLKKLLDLIDIFDTRVFEGDRVRLFPLKSNLARDVINDLKTIFAGYGLSETGGAVRFLALERVNSVLVITGNATIFPEVEKWIERLDQPLANSGLRNYVYRAKNTKAIEIAGILTRLYGGTPQQTGTPATPAPGQQPAPAPGPVAPFPAPAPAPGSAVSVGVVQGNVRIIADDITNTIIIQATAQQWTEIERTLDQLDVLPRQVLIDAQVYEVALDNTLTLGLTASLQNRGTLAVPQTTASFAGSPPSLSVQTFSFVGRTREIVAFLNASENRSRVRTLSAPSVLVKDNMVADFQVGAEVPVPTSSSVTPVTSAGTNLFAQTITLVPTGVILRVKPQINDSGALTLEISQEVSQAEANTTSAVVAPVIAKSAVTSTIVVQDNQTIALGGFIRENRDYATARVPLLGRIPVAGWLFGNTNTSTTRSELIVLITAHVVRTHDDAEAATNELKSRLKEIQKLVN